MQKKENSNQEDKLEESQQIIEKQEDESWQLAFQQEREDLIQRISERQRQEIAERQKKEEIEEQKKEEALVLVPESAEKVVVVGNDLNDMTQGMSKLQVSSNDSMIEQAQQELNQFQSGSVTVSVSSLITHQQNSRPQPENTVVVEQPEPQEQQGQQPASVNQPIQIQQQPQPNSNSHLHSNLDQVSINHLVVNRFPPLQHFNLFMTQMAHRLREASNLLVLPSIIPIRIRFPGSINFQMQLSSNLALRYRDMFQDYERELQRVEEMQLQVQVEEMEEGEEYEQDEERLLTQEQIQAIPVERLLQDPVESIPCSICRYDIERGNMTKRLWCQHRFHQKCIDEWLAYGNKCPNCKASVRPRVNQRQPQQ